MARLPDAYTDEEWERLSDHEKADSWAQLEVSWANALLRLDREPIGRVSIEVRAAVTEWIANAAKARREAASKV